MENEKRNEGLWKQIETNRKGMTCPDFAVIMAESDQTKNLPQPPLGTDAKNEIITVEANFNEAVVKGLYVDLLDARRSVRAYDQNIHLTRGQLAFLLWSSQGVQDIRGENYATLRPVPSGGARHPFELYFAARNVEGLAQGIYRYLPLANVGSKKVSVETTADFPGEDEIAEMLAGQKWASSAPIVFFFSCVAYRAEWRYSVNAHRVVLIDLGHAGQNLTLSAAAAGLGSCCIAAYNQKLCDEALRLDGFEEYTVYAVAAGKAADRSQAF